MAVLFPSGLPLGHLSKTYLPLGHLPTEPAGLFLDIQLNTHRTMIAAHGVRMDLCGLYRTA